MASTNTTINKAAPPHAAINVKPAPHTAVFCLLLAVITLVSYSSIERNHFIAFDDAGYIFMNLHVQEGLTWSTLRWSFTTFHEGNWHPLTWLSHALDYQLFHSNPIGHHYTNLLFHCANAVLLFLLLIRATGARWASWLVAALFALHPINVESIAWAAERKNVLSMLFFLLALFAYDRYAHCEAGGEATRDPAGLHLSPSLLFTAVVVCFALGLMAKAQIVTLPFVLLLWDYWPLGRMSPVREPSARGNSLAPPCFWSLVWEKWPLFALAAADSVITVIAQRAGNAVRTVSQVPLAARLENAIVSYVRYLGKAFWPVHLAALYPRPGSSLPLWQVGASLALLVLISAFVLRERDRRYLAMGWFWFLGTLIPMIGIITVGEQGMADRYAYLPFVGLFIAVVWAVRDLGSRYEMEPMWLAIPGAAVLCILGFLTHRQVHYWFDDETLWRYTLSVTDKNYMADNNLALALADQGRIDEAIPHFRAAYAIHQYPADQLLKLGLYELRMGQFDAALEAAKTGLAAAQDPATRAAALREIGRALLSLHRFDEADEAYRDALGLNPDDADTLVNSGLLALHFGNTNQAVDNFARAAKLDPRDVNFLLLEQALLYAGRTAEADAALAQARSSSANFTDSQQAVATFLGMASVPFLTTPSRPLQ
ncbi:MAG TPA: tetratricopeptide repeat protein [Terriglobales bacterium]|nr:tetratricopeptide repeat protein [Terriglobales bacterium]